MSAADLHVTSLQVRNQLLHSGVGIGGLLLESAAVSVIEIFRLGEEFGASFDTILARFSVRRALRHVFLPVLTRQAGSYLAYILSGVYIEHRFLAVPALLDGVPATALSYLASSGFDKALTRSAAKLLDQDNVVPFSTLPDLEPSAVPFAATALYVAYGSAHLVLTHRVLTPLLRANRLLNSALPATFFSSHTGFRLTQTLASGLAAALLTPIDILKREQQLHKKQDVQVRGVSGLALYMCKYYRGWLYGFPLAFATVLLPHTCFYVVRKLVGPHL